MKCNSLITKGLIMGENNKVRKSNIELLRILAMFLVLVVHANFFTLGAPTYNEIGTMPVSSFTRIFFQSLSIICVNVFVLISGWFGIKPSFQRFANFLFQCLFFLVGIYTICLLFKIVPLSVNGILGCICLTPWNWFIKSYILLMILAPVINKFIETSTKEQVHLVIIGYYLFQTIFGWLNGAVLFFISGCSTISFIGLYMLARYIRLFPNKYTTLNKEKDLLFFILIILVQAVIVFILPATESRIFTYISPLVILSSVYLLLFFSKVNFVNKFVNYIAISSFAVFLLHTNPNICKPYFQQIVEYIYSNFSGLSCLFFIFIFLVAVFAIAVIIDKFRISIWNLFWNKFLFKYQ